MKRRSIETLQCLHQRQFVSRIETTCGAGWSITRSFGLSVSIALLCALCFAGQSKASDDIGQFLERHGLEELLSVHLEDQIEQAQSSEARDALVLRLAEVYASLLDREQDEARRAQLEERSRRLLSRAPPNTADELRLALIRASYLRAETIAERHRLRLATEDEVGRARAELNSIADQLRQLASHYDSSIQSTNARLARAGGVEAATLYERLNRLERMRSSSRFLLAWSLYYRAFLAGDGDTAGAERLFADALLTDVSRPQPEDISRDLRAFEPTARAIVGMALCKSLSGSNATMAIRWMDLLDDEQTFEGVQAQAPAWTLAIRLEHSEFRHARELLERERHARGALPVTWLRMAAAWAIEAERNHSEARELVQYAVAHLAAAGELQQILMLAERYGPASLGTSGFAVRYVNGLIHYREARDLQAEGDYDGERVRALYADAVAELEAALRERDAADHPDAAAACKRLVAWALYFSGDYIRASEAFQAAAEESEPHEAAEALWMAIVCMDRLVQAGGERFTSRREALIDQFLATYPASSRAATLLVNRAIKAEDVADSEIARLLAVPPNHESYYEARRRVALALYQRFRRESGQGRATAAEAFLGVATPLLDVPAAFGAGDDRAAVDRRFVHARRVLEAALHEGVNDSAAAARALGVVERIKAADPEAAADHQDEIDYRRLQVHLVDHETNAATKLAEALWQREASAGIWARLAARAMFQHAHMQWKSVRNPPAETLRSVIRFGGRVLREYDPESDPAALQRRNVLAYHAAVAEASFLLWRDHDHPDEGARALFLYQRMIEHHPRNAAFLRNGAVLAGHPDIGRYEFAADCWRTLSAGHRQGSNEWFEARLGLIAALAEIDTDRAREVMRQHRQLYPGYGPEPWDDAFRELDAKLAGHLDPEARG